MCKCQLCLAESYCVSHAFDYQCVKVDLKKSPLQYCTQKHDMDIRTDVIPVNRTYFILFFLHISCM